VALDAVGVAVAVGARFHAHDEHERDQNGKEERAAERCAPPGAWQGTGLVHVASTLFGSIAARLSRLIGLSRYRPVTAGGSGLT
jgi:hypothetical protein